MKTVWKIFWGIFFVLAAVYLVASRIADLPEIGFFSIVLSICCLAMVIDGLIKLHFFELLFGIAFFCCLNDKLLGIEEITPWPVLGAALLGSIGLSILFRRRKKQNAGCKNVVRHDGNVETTEETYSADNVSLKNNFGKAVKYIKSDNMCIVNVGNSFGSLTVSFDHAIIQQNEAYLHVDNSFGETILFIPKEWKINNSLISSLGNIEEQGRSEGTSAHTLNITGNTNFGSIVIHYI